MSTHSFTRAFALAALALATTVAIGFAAERKAEAPILNGMSPAGLRAAASISDDPSAYLELLPESSLEAVRAFVAETKALGLASRTTVLYLPGPTNVQANNVALAPDRIGESQSEIAVSVFRDTVVIGWNDSFGFTAGGGTGAPGPPTLSSFAYSTNGGATFIDGGNVPLALATDQAFGDPGIDTDERGNWYSIQIYTRAAGAPGATAQQNIAVHHGRFNGAGVLVWDPPTQAIIGAGAAGVPAGNMDKCLIACDRVTGNVYVTATRLSIAVSQIEIARSTTQGATWDPPIILDATSTPTTSKQAARPFCGPNGEVYVVWEKGANLINCPDGTGNVSNPLGQIAFTRSLNFGASYDPFSIIGNVDLTFMASGPGDLRERGNEFPDIGVDMTNGCYRGNIYVTWHEAGTWTSNLAAGPARAEAADAANNNPTGAETFLLGEDVTGTMSTTADFDYWTFTANQGDNLLFNLDPGTFNCGVTGTTAGMRLRLFATQSPYPNPTGFPDSLLAASAQGTFADRIVWTCPKTGSYVIRLQRTNGTTPFAYRLRMRTLTYTATSPARDARDITLVRSTNQGVSWSAEQRINDDPAGLENRRPFVGVNNEGAVSVFWHDSRDPGLGTNAALTSIYGTTSRDGGLSWTPNYPVTDELSFFSFNTIGVPNLGDYNMVSANGTSIFHPAWTDQRLSTGDVRTPGTNVFTAGTGPNAVTTGVAFALSTVCPPDTIGAPGATVIRRFRIQNTGTVPDQYTYSVTDAAGWITGVSGTTPMLQASSFFDVFVSVLIPTNCTPPSDVITLNVLPVGEACFSPHACATTVNCDLATATLVERFSARLASGGVELDWTSGAVGAVREWNLYRSQSETDGFVRINAAPIAMRNGGDFHYRDAAAPAGPLYYRLAGVLADGSEEVMETRSLNTTAGKPFAFAMVGSNPFTTRTSVSYSLPQAAHVKIDVFSVTGQKVRTLENGLQDAGTHTVSFNRQDAGGRKLGAGIYLVRITAGSDSKSLRVVAVD